MKEKQTHRLREHSCGCQRSGEREGLGVWGWFKTDKNKVLLYIAQGTTANPLGINYNGKEYEKECINESLCYTAEIGTRLSISCTSNKK